MIVLTTEQEKAVDVIVDWYRSRSSKLVFKLGGYAGTGKTTLIGRIAESIGKSIAFVAFTAKAALVLKSKLHAYGIYTDRSRNFCGTIHSLIYKPVIDEKTQQVIAWEKKDYDDLGYDLIVIDEASMVDEFILNDLLSYETPILAVGDCFQIPPVEGRLNLMDDPDMNLTEIHRQAKDNPIIQMSLGIRRDGWIKYGVYGPSVAKVPRHDSLKGRFIKGCKKDFSDTLILAGFNSTRVKINKAIRNNLGFEGDFPQEGEKIICLKNNYDAKNVPLINGQTGTAVNFSDFHTHLEAQVKIHGEDEWYFGPVSKVAFNNPKPKIDYKKEITRLGIDERLCDLKKEKVGVDYFDFGYCMTVHKAQGSQAKRVMIVEERFPRSSDEHWARWLYTAVTRSEEQLLILG